MVTKVERRPAHPSAHARSRVYVDQLAVAPEARRHGHGRALMAAVHDDPPFDFEDPAWRGPALQTITPKAGETLDLGDVVAVPTE